MIFLSIMMSSTVCMSDIDSSLIRLPSNKLTKYLIQCSSSCFPRLTMEFSFPAGKPNMNFLK